FNRTHHHPAFRGWEPGRRSWDAELSADPVGWVGRQLCDLDSLAAGADIDPRELDPRDAAELRAAVPEILDALHRLLDRVHSGELAAAPGEDLAMARDSWL
ncbi:MAG: hypothetical protein ACR2KC_06505, partial [Acidimicrobiales bacterium]